MTGVLKVRTLPSFCNNTAFDECYISLAFWCCPSCSLVCCCEPHFVSGKVLLAFTALAPLEDTDYAYRERCKATLAGKLSVLWSSSSLS